MFGWFGDFARDWIHCEQRASLPTLCPPWLADTLQSILCAKESLKAYTAHAPSLGTVGRPAESPSVENWFKFFWVFGCLVRGLQNPSLPARSKTIPCLHTRASGFTSLATSMNLSMPSGTTPPRFRTCVLLWCIRMRVSCSRPTLARTRQKCRPSKHQSHSDSRACAAVNEPCCPKANDKH